MEIIPLSRQERRKQLENAVALKKIICKPSIVEFIETTIDNHIKVSSIPQISVSYSSIVEHLGYELSNEELYVIIKDTYELVGYKLEKSFDSKNYRLNNGIILTI